MGLLDGKVCDHHRWRAAGWAAAHALLFAKEGAAIVVNDLGWRRRRRAPAAATRWPTRFVEGDPGPRGGQGRGELRLGFRDRSRGGGEHLQKRRGSTRSAKVDILVKQTPAFLRDKTLVNTDEASWGHRDPGAPEGHLLRDPPPSSRT